MDGESAFYLNLVQGLYLRRALEGGVMYWQQPGHPVENGV